MPSKASAPSGRSRWGTQAGRATTARAARSCSTLKGLPSASAIACRVCGTVSPSGIVTRKTGTGGGAAVRMSRIAAVELPGTSS